MRGWKRYHLARDGHAPDLAHLETPARALPPGVDLRPADWPVWDQEKLQSCTAHVAAALAQFLERREGHDHAYEPSRLFIYYNERILDGDPDERTTTMLAGLRCLRKYGYCREALWPYDPCDPERVATKPPREAYEEARRHKAWDIRRVAQRLDAMKACLAHGLPFTIGIEIYETYEAQTTRSTGSIPLPDPDKHLCLGGHAMLVVGYRDSPGGGVFLVRNSEGAGWGEQGYGTLPYDYACDDDLAHALWTAKHIR